MLGTIVAMTVGELENRAVYKRYNVVNSGPDSVLETLGAKFNSENVLLNVQRKNIFPIIFALSAEIMLVCPPNKQ